MIPAGVAVTVHFTAFLFAGTIAIMGHIVPLFRKFFDLMAYTLPFRIIAFLYFDEAD